MRYYVNLNRNIAHFCFFLLSSFPLLNWWLVNLFQITCLTNKWCAPMFGGLVWCLCFLVLVGSWRLLRGCWCQGRQTCWWNSGRGTHWNCWSLISWCIQFVLGFLFLTLSLKIKLQTSVQCFCVSRVTQFCLDNQKTFLARNISGFCSEPKIRFACLYNHIILLCIFYYIIDLYILFRGFQIHLPSAYCVNWN